MEKVQIKTSVFTKDGNIFAILATVKTALREAGTDREVFNTIADRVKKSSSYDEALGIILEYVELT